MSLQSDAATLDTHKPERVLVALLPLLPDCGSRMAYGDITTLLLGQLRLERLPSIVNLCF
jgi:hypothetical protein